MINELHAWELIRVARISMRMGYGPPHCWDRDNVRDALVTAVENTTTTVQKPQLLPPEWEALIDTVMDSEPAMKPPSKKDDFEARLKAVEEKLGL